MPTQQHFQWQAQTSTEDSNDVDVERKIYLNTLHLCQIQLRAHRNNFRMNQPFHLG